MKAPLRLTLCLCILGLAGCAGSRTLRDPYSSGRDGTRGSVAGEEEPGSLYPGSADADSLGAGDERLPQALGVLVDTLNSPSTFLTDLPDISDSLAAVTQARLPSNVEIFDYPVVVNRRVLVWIDRYLGAARSHFETSLRRSGRYLPMARRIFAEEGVPQDLAFLAHVESGFRYNARSPARALGLWQFMRGTARLYGLRCDSYVDERLDPEKLTRVAARHLHDLHDTYGDWYLALAAYNAGAGKVDRAIERAGTRDFWEIARTRYLRAETRNFVPAMLAATILSKSPGAYGLVEETDPPLRYETISVDSPTDLRVLAKCAGVSANEVRELNPCLLLSQTPPGEDSFDVHLPEGTGSRAAAALAEIPPRERLLFHRHRVRNGDTLWDLARRYGTSIRDIQNANRMGRRSLLHVGRTLLIPNRGLDPVDTANFKRDTEVTHVVRRGETLSRIARRYGLGMAELVRVNGIADPSQIYVGQPLRIPPTSSPGTAAVESPASPASLTSSGSAASPAAAASATSPPGTASADPVSEMPASGFAAGATTALDPPGEGSDPPSPSDPAWTDALGRGHSTAQLVEEAREQIQREAEKAAAEGAAAPGPTFHVVRRGETPSGIASRYGISLRQLLRWNDLGRRATIYPGQELQVREPGGGIARNGPERIHVVSRGDTLWSIARHYGVRISDLAAWNGLRKRSRIYPGQKLRVE